MRRVNPEYKNLIMQWRRKGEKDDWEMEIFGEEVLKNNSSLLDQLLDKLSKEFPTECLNFFNRLAAQHKELQNSREEAPESTESDEPPSDVVRDPEVEKAAREKILAMYRGGIEQVKEIFQRELIPEENINRLLDEIFPKSAERKE